MAADFIRTIKRNHAPLFCFCLAATLFYLIIVLVPQICVDGGLSTNLLLRSVREAKEECVENLTVSGSGGTITSPGYPLRYPASADCRWLLTAADPNASIMLRIDTLHIEPDPGCKLDYLRVLSGGSALSPPLVPALCGHLRDKVLRSNSSVLTLLFHSDPVYEDKGFSIDYFTQTAGDCQASASGYDGVLRSPGFPENYPDSVDCWTVLSANPDQRILLRFDSLDLEYGDNCTFDYVQIYDGATRDSPLMGQLCRLLESKTSFESSSNFLLLHFHSDESVNRRGFRAHYSSVDQGSLALGDCLWEKSETNGTIASPNYPAQYPSNANCSVHLRAPDNHTITVAFESLQLEIDANCSYDRIQIWDGPAPSSKLTGTFCGRKSEHKNLTSETNQLRLFFTADDFGEFSGFKLQYWFESNFTEESSGEELGLEFVEVPENATISAGDSHIMRCSTSHPIARIRWLKDGEFLAGGEPLRGLRQLSDGSVRVVSMGRHLQGRYTCVLVAEGKTASTTAHIALLDDGKDDDNQCAIVFRKVPRDGSFAEGEFAHLECLAAGPRPALSWLKDGQPLLKGERVTLLTNGYLFIDKAEVGDAGVYTCVAEDTEAGCSKRASALLQVSRRANIEQICGIPKVAQPSEVPIGDHGKIVGGHNTVKGAFPWQVMLWESTLNSFCGATLLNERWIITAAHCFINYRNLRWDRVVVKIGKHDREKDEFDEFRTTIADLSSVIVHPAYDRHTFDNDIAMVRMRDHVRFSDYILPVCIADEETLISRRNKSQLVMGTVTGWGKLKELGPAPRFLQQIQLPIVDRESCVASTNYTVSRNMFCAGYAQETLGDACHGDSGGPLLVRDSSGRWRLLGIVSWGEGCGKEKKYGFYTLVTNYLPWIRGIMRS